MHDSLSRSACAERASEIAEQAIEKHDRPKVYNFSLMFSCDVRFGLGGQTQLRPANYTVDIIVHTCVLKHTCTLCTLTLIARWNGYPTRPGRDQYRRLYVLSEARGLRSQLSNLQLLLSIAMIRKTQEHILARHVI